MPNYDIILKTIAPQLAVSMRERMTDLERLGVFFRQLESYVPAHGGHLAGPGLIVYHDTEFVEGCLDAEAVYPITAPVPPTDAIHVSTLPGVTAACLVYSGTYEAVGEAHRALAEWIDAHNYQIAGPHRVVFLQCDDANDTAEKTVIEIQYPVTHS